MSRRNVIAIMQPTYLPWIGYFAMIDRVDEFIYLDSVQFARRSWQQRNRIKTAGKTSMLTIPVFSKGLRDQSIIETKMDLGSRFARRHWRSIENAYRHAPFFAAHAPDLSAFFAAPPAGLADFSIGLIDKLCDVFGIATPRRRSSTMASQGNKADLLSALCREAGASHYLSAPGSRDYLDESSVFTDAGIVVEYQCYDHPTYAQGQGDFLPYMAAIDLLFHLGAEQGLVVLRSGVRR